MMTWFNQIAEFQSTLPVRGATLKVFSTQYQAFSFQSTLPVRGATQILSILMSIFPISIHAPRAGSDLEQTVLRLAHRHFNPRSPCGERPLYGNPRGRERAISIHAPRAGSDSVVFFVLIAILRFQSTLPVRGATTAVCLMPLPWLISIHAPRAGSDVGGVFGTYCHFAISIHAPRAGSDY